MSYELKLTDGIIEMLPFSASGGQGAATLTLNDGVLPVATDSSYVEGKVKKIGNDAFTFPIGTNGHYRPIGISAPTNTTDAYTAEHRNEDSNATYSHSSKDSTINEIGINEYWWLDRTTGISDITVTLSWDDMSCSFDTLANLRMVAYDTTGTGKWKDLGNGGTTGDSLVGTMNSNGASSFYGAYALATVDTFRCVPCRADAGVDFIVWPTNTTQIGENATIGNTYLWSPTTGLSSSTVADPMASPQSSQIYTVTATNSSGCAASDEMFIKVISQPKMPPCLYGN